MTVEIDVIDALVADIEANADLPEHNTVKYRRPLAIVPEDCPLLVVWLVIGRPTRSTNVTFDSVLTVGVSWHVETVEQAQTLIEDPAKSAELLVALGKIRARVRELSRTTLGVEHAWEVLPSDTTYLPPEMQQGFTEGYGHEVLVQVTEE